MCIAYAPQISYQGIFYASQIHVFTASGGVCVAYAVALLPCYRNGIHKIRMYPGRGVLHTPTECFRRKQRGVPIHKNDHSPSPAAFVGRMLLHPYTIGKSEIKKQGRIRYPCRGILHTPHKYPIKDHPTLHKYAFSLPPAAFVGRMQYAPTLPENLKSKKKNESGTRVGAYCIRPTNILSRTILCYTNIRLRRLWRRLGGVCCCVPTFGDF